VKSSVFEANMQIMNELQGILFSHCMYIWLFLVNVQKRKQLNKNVFAHKGNCLTILSGFKLHNKKNKKINVIFNVEKLAPLTGA
jgi:hypothetical protein